VSFLKSASAPARGATARWAEPAPTSLRDQPDRGRVALLRRESASLEEQTATRGDPLPKLHLALRADLVPRPVETPAPCFVCLDPSSSPSGPPSERGPTSRSENLALPSGVRSRHLGLPPRWAPGVWELTPCPARAAPTARQSASCGRRQRSGRSWGRLLRERRPPPRGEIRGRCRR